MYVFVLLAQSYDNFYIYFYFTFIKLYHKTYELVSSLVSCVGLDNGPVTSLEVKIFISGLLHRTTYEYLQPRQENKKVLSFWSRSTNFSSLDL